MRIDWLCNYYSVSYFSLLHVQHQLTSHYLLLCSKITNIETELLEWHVQLELYPYFPLCYGVTKSA